MPSAYPFSALVAGSDLKLALLLGAVQPAVGGVLIRGEKGTAKSTAVRGLAALLPDIAVVVGCPFSCDPEHPDPGCPAGPHDDVRDELRPARLVELPVGASEDRVAGSLDLERALTQGHRAFEPGLLAAAHRGVLYVDEVNLLGDHLVDLLLDAAAMGVNHVEREGISVRHAARFQLVGTMNPEEGELRPQLLDRFGLSVEVRASRDPAERAEVVRRRLAYEQDPDGFAARWADADAEVAARIRAARKLVGEVVLPNAALEAIVATCAAFEVDGLRADIVTAKAAVAHAAWEGRTEVSLEDVRAAALLALPHRRRRGPFEQPGLDEDRLDETLREFADDPEEPPPDGRGTPHPDRCASSPGDSTDNHAHPGEAGEGCARLQGDSADNHAHPGEAGEGCARLQGDSADNHAQPEVGPEVGEGESTTLPVGATFDPRLLALPDAGAGPSGRRSPARGEHGKHVGERVPRGSVADVAVVATLRAAAPHQPARGRTGDGLVLRRGDLREKVREGRESNLVLFVVDASGSMAARARMTAVKGAVLSLLLDAYQRRDRVGLITFRGQGAQVALPPTESVDLAARLLDDLPTGGRTPLAAGLHKAREVLAAEAVRDPDRRALLVLLTDGRTTAGPDPAAAAAALAGRCASSVVVDTENSAVRLGLARGLAEALSAPCIRLEELAGDSLAGVVRGLTSRNAA